jgi:hypothetical protein
MHVVGLQVGDWESAKKVVQSPTLPVVETASYAKALGVEVGTIESEPEQGLGSWVTMWFDKVYQP